MIRSGAEFPEEPGMGYRSFSGPSCPLLKTVEGVSVFRLKHARVQHTVFLCIHITDVMNTHEVMLYHLAVDTGRIF